MKVICGSPWLLAGLLWLMTLCLSARANVYASDIRLNGSLAAGVLVRGGVLNISYILNDTATAGVWVRIWSGSNVVKTFSSDAGEAGTNAGLNAVTNGWDGVCDNSSNAPEGVYTVSITAASAGYETWTNMTDDGSKFFVNLPTGITVNKNTNSPYYGRVFVGNGYVGNGMANGIYKYNADGSAADEGGLSLGGYQWGNGGLANPSPWKMDISADDILYVDDWAGDGVVVSFDQTISSNNPFVLRPDNYPPAPRISLSGPCVRGAGTNTQIYMADVIPVALGGLGIICWTLGPGGVTESNDPGTVVVTETNNSDLNYAPYAVSVDTNGEINTIQRLWDQTYTIATNDPYAQVLSFPPYLEGNPPDTNSLWHTRAGDPTLVNAYGVAVDPTATFVAVASRGWGGDTENLEQGGVSLFWAADGLLVTNISQDPAGNTNQEFVDVSWDNAGNLYALDFSDSVWRVYSPPGSNQSTTVAAPIIQVLDVLNAPQLSQAWAGMGQLNFTLTGQSNVTYVIEQSPDLIVWTPVATNYSPTSVRAISISPPDTQDFYMAVTSP